MRKVWTGWKFLSTDIRYFVVILRIVAIYALFGRFGSKSVFWDNNSVSWARSALPHDIYCILYWIKLSNLQLRAKTTHFSQANTRLTIFFGIMCFIYCAKTLKSPTLDISNTNFKSFLPFALVKIRVQTSGSAAVAPEITWSASKPVSILHHKQAISNKLWCFVQFIAAWPILGRKTWKSSFFFCKYATYKAIV